MRLRHKKGTFSSDENNFLLTSQNRAVKEETKRLLFRPVGRGPEGGHRDRTGPGGGEASCPTEAIHLEAEPEAGGAECLHVGVLALGSALPCPVPTLLPNMPLHTGKNT